MERKTRRNFPQNKRQALQDFLENASAFFKKVQQRLYFIHPQMIPCASCPGGGTAMH